MIAFADGHLLDSNLSSEQPYVLFKQLCLDLQDLEHLLEIEWRRAVTDTTRLSYCSSICALLPMKNKPQQHQVKKSGTFLYWTRDVQYLVRQVWKQIIISINIHHLCSTDAFY